MLILTASLCQPYSKLKSIKKTPSIYMEGVKVKVFNFASEACGR
jgi:hypothetical protein